MKMKRNYLYLLLFAIFATVNSGYAATLEGTVTYDGKIPKLKAIKMNADADCMKKHSETPKSQALVLGDGNTMGNIFVGIKGKVAGNFPGSNEQVVIDQKGCLYEPHVLAVQKGQPIKFRNSDGIMHNVHALPKSNKEFNISMPGSMQESDTKKFDKEETNPFKVKCDVHPWMQTFIRVMPHPFFDVTSSDGKFKIDNLPAGTYQVEFWHEKLGSKTQEITVADSDSKTLDYVFKR